MSTARYPAYKDSGVEWLGEVPGHWEVKRIRFVAELNPSKSELSQITKDQLVSFIPMEAIGEDGTLDLERERPISDVETGYTFFRDGDVTVAKITPCFENGKGAVMRGLQNGYGFGTTELIVIRPREGETFGEYLHWLFISTPFRKSGESFMYGAGGQKRVPDDFVRNFSVAFPGLAEQQAIATFLDTETAKIDGLMAEQRAFSGAAKGKAPGRHLPRRDQGLEPGCTHEGLWRGLAGGGAGALGGETVKEARKINYWGDTTYR